MPIVLVYVVEDKNFPEKRKEKRLKGWIKGAGRNARSKWRQGIFIIRRRAIPSVLFIDPFLHILVVNDKIDE